MSLDTLQCASMDQQMEKQRPRWVIELNGIVLHNVLVICSSAFKCMMLDKQVCWYRDVFALLLWN